MEKIQSGFPQATAGEAWLAAKSGYRKRVRETCKIRGWVLLALNARTNHIHTVVSANSKPEPVLNAFKANATREMREVMESTIETGAERVRGFLKQLRGKVYVTFEEGTQANWLHDIVRPLELAREHQHSTTEQGAVATWPFRDTQPLVEWHRNGQVATTFT